MRAVHLFRRRWCKPAVARAHVPPILKATQGGTGWEEQKRKALEPGPSSAHSTRDLRDAHSSTAHVTSLPANLEKPRARRDGGDHYTKDRISNQ